MAKETAEMDRLAGTTSDLPETTTTEAREEPEPVEEEVAEEVQAATTPAHLIRLTRDAERGGRRGVGSPRSATTRRPPTQTPAPAPGDLTSVRPRRARRGLRTKQKENTISRSAASTTATPTRLPGVWRGLICPNTTSASTSGSSRSSQTMRKTRSMRPDGCRIRQLTTRQQQLNRRSPNPSATISRGKLLG